MPLVYSLTSNTDPSLFSSIAINGGELTLEYASNAFGSADLTLRATDTGGKFVETTFRVTVNAVNDAPLANGESYEVDQGSPLIIAAPGLLANDSDIENDFLTAVLVSGPDNGNLVLNADGSFEYTPNGVFAGSDSFIYQAHDGSLDSNNATVTITVSPVSGTKFYVVDNSVDDMFEYSSDFSLQDNYDLYNQGTRNTAPKGVAADVTGNTVWVIDNDDYVYVYDADGSLLRSWKALGLDRPEGIASDGSDVWIVDRGTDQVHYFAGGATRTGNVSANSTFALAAGNPRGITTDGIHLWVVDTGTDDVYKYAVNGSFLGNWALDTRNTVPRGITIDPANVNDIWVVDSTDDAVYRYESAASRTSGSQVAADVSALAPGNTNPQGIADPPPASDSSAPVETERAQADFEISSLRRHVVRPTYQFVGSMLTTQESAKRIVTNRVTNGLELASSTRAQHNIQEATESTGSHSGNFQRLLI